MILFPSWTGCRIRYSSHCRPGSSGHWRSCNLHNNSAVAAAAAANSKDRGFAGDKPYLKAGETINAFLWFLGGEGVGKGSGRCRLGP